MVKKFDPSEHLRKLGGRDYLEVKYRLLWVRESDPGASIVTEMLHYEPNEYAVFRATVTLTSGAVGVGHKYEDRAGFDDFIEKAETGAVGRALAVLGFGTQFAVDLDEGERIVDSPISRPPAQHAARPPQQGRPTPPPESASTEAVQQSPLVSAALEAGAQLTTASEAVQTQQRITASEMTDPQRRALFAITNKHGWDLDDYVNRMFGCRVSELSRLEASEVIKSLQAAERERA